MSLLTQCPACQTYYRVVPDQLRISDGWVKCGQCSDIFDASLHLIEVDTSPVSSGMVSDSNAAPAGQFQSVPATLTKPDESAVTPHVDLTADIVSIGVNPIVSPEEPRGPAPNELGLDHIEASTSRHEPNWASPEIEVEALRDVVPQLEFPDDKPISEVGGSAAPKRVRWDDEVEVSPAVEPVFVLRAESATQDVGPEQTPPVADVTFLTKGRVHAAWHKPLIRRALISLASLLLVMLIGQWVYVERDRLSATRPALKPALQAFCNWTGCAIQSMRQIDALTIDSVAFTKLDKDSYRLSFLVKNASEFPLAYPAVELVLTDAQDQAAYRRVLTNSELGSGAGDLAAGIDWPVTVDLQINGTDATQRVFGYRLLVFYP